MKRYAIQARLVWLVTVTMGLALTPRLARAVDGSQVVAGGGEISFTGATETNWVKNADGSSDFLITYTDATSSGKLTFPGATKARILAIGGGGGGGGEYTKAFVSPYGGAGGGGAGGFVETNDVFSAATYVVTVGAGGKPGLKSRSSPDGLSGENGGNTSLVMEGDEGEGIVAYGGGGGGAYADGGGSVSIKCGSGGGGSQGTTGTPKIGGQVTTGQGNNGGAGDVALYGGGGGGAGSKGSAASEGSTGGDGKSSNITGTEIWYAGGGGGGYADYRVTTGGAIPGGQGGGGQGGYGKVALATAGTDGLGGGGGGADGYSCNGAYGGSGVVIVRISGALSGGLQKPKDVNIQYDGKPHTSYQTSPFYTVDGVSTATDIGVYPVTVTPRPGIKWDDDGSTDAVSVSMTIYAADSKSGTEMVTGFPVKYMGAAEVSWVGGDLLLKFTGAGSFTMPGTTKARILAVGGGGGGAGEYLKGFASPYGGAGGGGAGGFLETNGMFAAGTYAVGVGVGGTPGVMSKTFSKFFGGDGGDTRILRNSGTWITAYGGGGGGGYTDGRGTREDKICGSGGGGSKNNTTGDKCGGKGLGGQGNDGGAGNADLYGGGGGGAGSAGLDASSPGGGKGGDGKSSDITGEDTWYAGGGGGGYADYRVTTGEAIPGGMGGGGQGGFGKAALATAGVDGLGGGGGGADGNSCNGAAGGSGVVYVRISATMVGELTKPEKIQTYTYDGNAHTSVVASAFYELTGENVGTEVGEYNAQVKLYPGVTWPGGDTESPVNVKMTINKIHVDFLSLTMASWEYTAFAAERPSPGCVTSPAWVQPIFEYATSQTAPEAEWTAERPSDVGDYWVRARVPDTKNYEGTTVYASFKITKRKVVFTELVQKDWMFGTPDESTPRPRCVYTPTWMSPVYEYAASETSETWAKEKPTEIGTWYIRASAPDKTNYDYTPKTASFRITKGLGHTFVDYVEITIDGWSGSSPSVLSNFPYKVTLNEDTPYGFLYERAGEDGQELGVTDADGEVLAYRVDEWNTHGESVIYIRIPEIGARSQTIRLYWKLRPGATAPDHKPDTVWEKWKREDVAKLAVPGHVFDLVVRAGYRVNYWITRPTISKSIWAKGEAAAVITPGQLAEGNYAETVVNAVTGATVTYPPIVGGAYRLDFTLLDPNLEYESLSHSINFAITESTAMDDLQGDAPSLTANGRVLIANDDCAVGHEVSGQSYWRTDPGTQSIYWEHTGTHAVPTLYLPNLGKYAGSMHRLNYLDESGKTNLLWRLSNVILGNTFKNPTLEEAKCFLPWSATGLPISADTSSLQGARDESGWMVLRNMPDAIIYSPCYTNGIGTIYFDAVNTYAILQDEKKNNYSIAVDIATNVLDEAGHSLPPTDENAFGDNGSGDKVEFARLKEERWMPAKMLPFKRDNNAAQFTRQELTDVLHLDIRKGGTVSNFFRICVNLDCRCPVRFRIRRVQPISGVDDLYTAGIAIDNLLVSYPRSTVNLQPVGKYDPEKTGKRIVGHEGAMSVAFPSLNDTEVYGRATNEVYVSDIVKADPKGFVLLSRMHYRWRYLNQASNDWQSVDLNPFDDFRAAAPLKLPYDEGDIEFFYESFLNVPYYKYYDYSGANFGLGGLYTEEQATLTNRLNKADYSRFFGSGDDWFFRLRAGRSEWDEVSVIVDGSYKANVAMELIGDHLWRGLVKVPSNLTGRCTFRFNALAKREDWSTAPSEVDRWWFPAADVPKMPWRGETVSRRPQPEFTYAADGASGYIEFQLNDETGIYMIGHAEYQSFNAWHDAHRADGKFVGNYSETSGVNVAAMIQTNAHMYSWSLHKTTDSNWNEPFTMTDYLDPGYPKYTDTYFLTHKMPHQWNGENGIFVDATLTASNAQQKVKNSGIAWQMRGKGLGTVSYTQNNLPNGLDAVNFKARLAQTIGFDDFSIWDGDGSSTAKNYTFCFPALMSANNGNDYSPGATMSIVGYYRPRRGCYEFRVERTTNDGLLFSIYKWVPQNGEIVATCVKTHWFSAATFQYSAGSAAPNLYHMFISVGEETAGATTVIAGLSTDRAAPSDTYSRKNHRAIRYIDSNDDRLLGGGYGALTANCTGMFMMPRHWTSYLPSGNLTWSRTATDVAESQAIVFVNSGSSTAPTEDRKLLEQDMWALTPGRIEYFTQMYGTLNAVGLRPPTDMYQNVGVYLKSLNDGGSWSLYQNAKVSTYGFADFKVTIRTNEECQVMLKAGTMPSDVTVWQIEQTGWSGEDITSIDGISKDFVYTQARIVQEIDSTKTTNRFTVLQPSRAVPTKALSIRSPVLQGLGMAGFSYKNVQPGAEIWLQVISNNTDRLSGSMGYNYSTKSVDIGQPLVDGAWITLKKWTAAELGSSGEKTYYLGWHTRQDDPLSGVFRLFVPTNVVVDATAKVKTTPEYGSITVTDFYVHDEPAIDLRSWWGWNLRTIGDGSDSEKRMFLPDIWSQNSAGEIGAGLSAGLNNSYTVDIAADPSEYDKNNPFIQSPTFGRYQTASGLTQASIGAVRFKARLYGKAGDPPAKVTLYGVIDGTTMDWGDPITNFTVTAGRYANYEYRAPSNLRFASVRLVVDGVMKREQNLQRVLLDEVVVSERSTASVGFSYARPFRTGLDNDLVVEDILDKCEQPLVDESWGVQTQLKLNQFSDDIDTERGFRVTFRYFVGEKPWGYDKWMEEPAASKEVNLMQVGAKKDLIFRSTATDSRTVGPVQRTANTVVQYMLNVYYYEKGAADEQSQTIALSEVEGEGWTNPAWYSPIDYNRIGGRSDGDLKASTSPYVIFDTVSPGRAWINEVNYNDGPKAQNNRIKVVTNQFIEIAVPWGIDMTGWKLRLTDMKHDSLTLAVLGRNGLPGLKRTEDGHRSGDYDFYVLESPETYRAGGIRDAVTGKRAADGTWSDSTLSTSTFSAGTLQYDEPYQLELVRPSGIVEHQFVIAGTNEWRDPLYYQSFGYQYDGTNLLNELNVLSPSPNRFFAGEDIARLTTEANTLASFGVTGGAHGEDGGWTGDMRFTPGRVNEGQDALTGWWIRANGGACWVYASVVGSHLSQRIGTDTATNTFFIISEGGTTNIEYTVAPWYQLDTVNVEMGTCTTNVPLAKEGKYVFTLENVTGTTYVVAHEAIAKRLVDTGLDPADRYTPAVMRWLEAGVADGKAFRNPGGEIRKMTYRAIGETDESKDVQIGLKGMYWFDIDPTEGGWWMRGRTMNIVNPVNRTWYTTDSQTPYNNVKVQVKLFLSNETSRVVFAPKRLQGVGGERSDDLASYSNWTSETFKVEGMLFNGKEHNVGYLPFRWFVFGLDSFEPQGSANEFTTWVELVDPFSKASPGYTYGWSDYKGSATGFRWNLTEALQPTGVEMLNKNSTYDGKRPFIPVAP